MSDFLSYMITVGLVLILLGFMMVIVSTLIACGIALFKQWRTGKPVYLYWR